MRLVQLLTALLFGLLATQLSAQCPGQDSVRLEINTDSYYYEESWKLTSADDAILYASGTMPDSATHVFKVCVPVKECIKFTIMDSANDGFFPDGFYRIFVNDTLIYERLNGSFFGPSESVIFNCPPGSSCTSPIYLNVGAGTTPSGNETWYSFTPPSTGTYVLSTCDAACPTRIWVYDKCAGIFISEDQIGTIFFGNSGCPDGAASVQVNLEGGKEYFIRIRYQDPGCSNVPIPYTLVNLGPVIGCMDPLACNYEPLATIQGDTCYYPGDPACPYAPDFTVNQELLRSSMIFSSMLNPDDCAVQEGCLRGTGTRYLIEFTTHIKNIGDADYHIGKPPANINEPSDQFVYDPCHHHWHYMGYADYILYNTAGDRIPIGSKTGFCVFDLECADGGFGQYDCINMGISAGCGDVYDIGLPCQWVDITDIPAGDYTLVVRVNWDKSPDKVGRVEKRYDNNWGQACFSLTYDNNNTPDVIFNVDSCKQFTDCLGEVYGNALPDCNGVCSGPALIGDWNQDTLRNSTDVMAYLSASLADDGTVTPCNELHDDGAINVFDAALLQECETYANTPQHWIQRFPCQFPTGFLNPQDLVTLQAGNLDTLAKTFDIEIVNPYNEIMAYEFSVSGIQIESVENLSAEHNATPQFNAASGEIIALASDESGINKHFTPAAFLRVHYAKLTDHKVCVSKITAVVNDKYQQSTAMIGDPNCIPVDYVSVSEPGKAPFSVFVQPNPMRQNTTIFFENKAAEPMSFTLTDLTGRTLRSVNEIYSESIQLQREDLPEGTYLFTLRSSKGAVSGKIVIQ